MAKLLSSFSTGILTCAIALLLSASGTSLAQDGADHAEKKTLRTEAEAQQAGPHSWFTDFDEAKAEAIRLNLPLVVHFHAKWCGPCRAMETTVIKKQETLDRLGVKVIGVLVDADDYPDLVSELDVKSLPTDIHLAPDGSPLHRSNGKKDLVSYTSSIDATAESFLAKPGKEKSLAKQSDESLEDSGSRCAIDRDNGTMVGLGGFSPVSYTNNRRWDEGSREFSAKHEGIEYYFKNEAERLAFTLDPKRYIPHCHGCDPVIANSKSELVPGKIEYGSFYNGVPYFFHSAENRAAFSKNPERYQHKTAFRLSEIEK